jgi:hypothetical protein
MESGEPACQQDTSRPAKGKRGTEKEKGEENSKTPQDQQKAKGEQKRKKGKRTNNSYCLFPYNNYCRRKFSKVK